MTDCKEPLDIEKAEYCRMIAAKIDEVMERPARALAAADRKLRSLDKALAADGGLAAKLNKTDWAAPSAGREIARFGAAIRQWPAQPIERGGETAAFPEAADDLRPAGGASADADGEPMTETAVEPAQPPAWDAGRTRGLWSGGGEAFRQRSYAGLSGFEFAEKSAAMTAGAAARFGVDAAEMERAARLSGGGLSRDGMAVSEQLAALGMLQAAGMSGSESAASLQAVREGAAEAQQSFVEKGYAVCAVEPAAGKLRPLADVLDEMREVFREESAARRKALVREAYGQEEAVRAFEALGGQAAALREAAAALERAARSAARRREDAGSAPQRLRDSTPEAADAEASGAPADGYDPFSFLNDARSVFYFIEGLEKLRRWRSPRRAPARGGSSAGSSGRVILDSRGRPATPSGSRGGSRRPALSVGNPLQIAGGKSRGFTARAGGRMAAAGRGLPVSLTAGMAGQGGRSLRFLDGGRIARQLAGTFGRANLLGAGIAAVGALPTLLDDEASGAEKAQAAGGAAGLAAGGMAGAKLGALAGAFGGPLGAAVGGVLGGAVGSFLGETALESAADAVASFLDFGGGEGKASAALGAAGVRGQGLGVRGPRLTALPDAAGMLTAAPAGFGGEARRPAAFDAPTRGGGDERGGTIVHAQQYGGVHVHELIIHQQPGEDPRKLADRVIDEIEHRAAQAERGALYDIEWD